MGTELGKAFVQIVPSAQGISGSIESALGGEVDKAGPQLGTKLAGGLKKAIAAAGIGVAIKKSLDFGAELQQNLGGSEAVFGKYAESMQNTAKTAYMNMGLSASDYMATANKMGSLFQGSGISQVKSLKMTEDAMQRAADVASVMGIDTSMAMESIAGAAKGNFTMMDNLGVAMNATTLQAYALEKGVNFNWNTASNAEKAELAMKMFMDRTSQYEGNFARESEETFSGSLGAMKAAVQDFMANLALGEDVGPAMTNLVTTASTFLFKNLIPAVINIIKSLPSAISTGLQTAGPLIVQQGGTLIKDLVNGIVQNGPQMVTAAKDTITNFVKFVGDNLPALADKAGEMIQALVSGLIAHGPDIAVGVAKVGAFLLKNLGKLALSLVDAGLKLIQGLVRGIVYGVGSLLGSAMNRVKTSITTPINSALNLIKTAINKIKSIVNNAKLSLPHFKLPHFNVYGGSLPWGIGGKGSPPSISVSWYKKAENQPYVFSGATLFGAGERNDEMLYGRAALMKDIREASSGSGDVTVNLNYDASDDATDMLRDIARGVRRYRMAGVI